MPRAKGFRLGAGAARATVLTSILFNAGLAFINANVVALTPALVIASEAALTAATAVIGLQGTQTVQKTWIGLAVAIVGIGLFNAAGSGVLDPKLIRDVLLIPVFVLLGLVCDGDDMIRVVIPLQIVVVAVMVFEGLWPEVYGRLFNVMSNYINTRGFQQDQFWNASSDLFVSATRPGERFPFNGLNIDRLSSVFLEPVSLGNYCVLVALVGAVLWSSLGLGQRLFLCCSAALILVGCDGRLATACILFILALRVVAPTLPRFLNWAYLPGALVVSSITVVSWAISPEGDDFPSRTAGSIQALSRMGAADLLGFATPRAYTVMNSGIAYLLYSQSLIGAVAIWSVIALGLSQNDRATAITAHGVSLNFALNLLISYSVFSIKTAALLWITYGAMVRPGAPARREGRERGKPGRREPAAALQPGPQPA